MISAIKNNQIYFGACRSWTNTPQDSGVRKEYTHQTSLLRNFATLDFTQNYIRKNFPQGTNIANFACSQGQEPYSLAMLLDDVNQDKKYKITGYDIVSDVVKNAKKGLFVIEPRGNESIFFPKKEIGFLKFRFNNQANPEDSLLKNEQATEKAKAAYQNFFEEIQPSKIDKSKTKEQALTSLAIRYFPENIAPIAGSKMIVAKPEKTEGVLDFKTGDINKIEETLTPQKNGVILFKNALYHIIGGETDNYFHANIAPAYNIFRQIHNLLPDNGIFVLGNLSRDHLQGSSDYGTRLEGNNGAKVKIFDSSKIHKALRETGFEPIYYEKGSPFTHALVPTIWKKINKA